MQHMNTEVGICYSLYLFTYFVSEAEPFHYYSANKPQQSSVSTILELEPQAFRGCLACYVGARFNLVLMPIQQLLLTLEPFLLPQFFL